MTGTKRRRASPVQKTGCTAAEQLAQTAERLARLPAFSTPLLPTAPAEAPPEHTDEHADDLEVAGTIPEE